ncbi:high-affinity nitrate transporter 3.1-like [Aristolochia californica]|uniref:high-affinity nitrate transporter 3.1-like n=1 Tax=Aristolochia californica TaxID=171875 RepID=UPI0035D9D46F
MASRLLIASILLCFMFGPAFGAVIFSTLPRTLIASTTTKKGSVLKAGEDTVKVTWELNSTLMAGADAKYSKVVLKLCFSPVSQEERAWRKTHDELDKDKTCMFKIVEKAYTKNKQDSYDWEIERDVPTATYFVRAYAVDSNGHEVAYGQSTNSQKTSSLFDIEAITGRHTSIDIAAAAFSAFSVVSLFVFFYVEKRKAKKSSPQPN